MISGTISVIKLTHKQVLDNFDFSLQDPDCWLLQSRTCGGIKLSKFLGWQLTQSTGYMHTYSYLTGVWDRHLAGCYIATTSGSFTCQALTGHLCTGGKR